MPAENVFLSSGDAFVDDALRPAFDASLPNQAPNARVSSVAPLAGYVDGIGRLRMMAWGYQKIGNNVNPAGVTNKFAIQGPLQFLQRELTLNMGGNFFQEGAYESIYDGLVVMQDGTAGPSQPPRGPYLIPTGVFTSRGTLLSPGPQNWAMNGANGTLNMGGYGKPGDPGGVKSQNLRFEGQNAAELVNDEAWYADTYIPTVAQRGAAIIKARGLSSAASAANAAIDHIRSWHLGTPEGDWVSMAIPSDGSYGVPEGLISSFPCVCKDGRYEIVQGLDINEFSRARIDKSVGELAEERDAVKELGLI